MTTITITSERVNNFDNWYMMSDDHNRYMKGKRDEEEILAAIEVASYDNLVSLYSDLSDNAKSNDLGKRILALIEEKKPVVVEAPKAKSIRSKVFTSAWAFIKKGIYSTLSEALTAAWAKYKLIAKLSTSVAHFSYRKANGELREAIGTLRDGNFDYDYKGAPISVKPDVIKYFDLVSNAWRSFRIERLVA